MKIDINTKMITLLGKPLGQSFAARMQNAGYEAAGLNMLYFYTEVDKDHLGDVVNGLRYMNFAGFAVTKPNKVRVLRYLDELDPLCKKMGASNTVVKTPEGKLIGYPAPWRNKVRTFCQNPGGFVAQENYDNDLAVVNGHSFKEKKSNNTNLAILVSHNFTEPFNQPIAYAQKVGELTNMLGAGHILVQRYGDILDGKRTWANELARTNVRPTLKDSVAGDITAAMPYRAMVNIIEFIKMMDEVVPGFASPETLLYSPELKFYSNKVKMDTDLETNIAGLHCLGDSSGWTRGLMMASVMGVLMGRKLMEKHGF
mgnify:CR=1 FL=1